MKTFKWLCFIIMLAGAVVVSLQLHPILGIVFLFIGNTAWLGTAVYYRDWPSASNFAMLATVWLIGCVKYYIGM